MGEKIPVAVLGATGMVGQKCVELLSRHPWFQIVALGASERSCGQPYGSYVRWMMTHPLPKEIATMKSLLACLKTPLPFGIFWPRCQRGWTD